MDTYMAYTGSTTARSASNPPPTLHSTTALLSSLANLANSSLNDHINDYADAHRWIDSFFEKLEQRPRGPAGAPRPAMSELMKTPGRKRVAGAGSVTHPSTHHLSLASAKKDPVATLLFPASAAKKSAHNDKENSPAPSPKNGSPRRMLSPLGSGKGKAPASLSPMRMGSPRGVLSPSRQQSTPVHSSRTAAPSPKAPVIAHDFALPPAQVEVEVEIEDVFGNSVHDLSNVMEEEEDEEEEENVQPEPEKVVEVEQEESVLIVEEEKADLSIIGEEEEEEEDNSNVSAVTAPSTQNGLVAQSSIIPETQFSQPTPLSPSTAPAVQTPTFEVATIPLSPPQRTVFGASSVAPEADGDTAVPLNDAPSTLRNAQSDSLSSSVPSSTRTPGNSSRFAVGSYSAAKLGMGSVGLGSSPPVAPSTTGKAVGDSRASVGGNGARLNFVGLPKKSLGLGLGLGRNWGANGSSSSSSQVSDSQPSTQASATTAPSQSTQATTASSANATAASSQNSVFETALTGTATSTGAVKRKSLTGPDTANKAAKVSPAPQTAQEQEQEEARKRREALTNRMQSLQARQSNIVAGRTSNAAGPFGSNPLLFGKSQHGPPSSLFLPISNTAGPASKPLGTSTSSTAIFNASTSVTPSAELASNPLARRPSVMERVKSFEQTSNTQEHLHPPSPSKIPAAFARSTSPKPSALSPRGMASPPASPRPLTRSATSGLPLATFASPGKGSQLAPPISGFGSPKLGAVVHRSPPPAAAPSASAASPGGPISISTILSPPPTAPLAAAPTSLPWSTASALSPPAPAPTSAPSTQPKFIPPAITAKPNLPTPPVVRSTTPDGSPPPPKGLTSILQRFDEEIKPAAAESFVIGEAEDEDELDDEEEEEDEVPSIRAINASIPPAAVVAAQQAQAQAKAAAAAAEREREAAAQKAAEQAARELEEQEAEREREELMKKRLPSLPEPQVLTPDSEEEDEEEEGEDDDDEVEIVTKPKQQQVASVVSTATKENLNVKASPSKIMMPGTFGAALVQQAKAGEEEQEDGSEDGDDEEEDEEEEEDEPMEDRTNMSMASSVATTSTFNYTAQSQGPFKPVKPHLAKQGSQTSLASSVSSSTALGLNRSISNTGLKKPEPTAMKKVNSIQQAKAAAKKEKEERDRKAALREEKRAALEKKKQDEERKVKIEVLEKKRKEREEAAAKAKANAAARALKRIDEEAPAKKRKTDQDQQQQKPIRSEVKKVAQPSRPLNASTSSQHISSLATSQNRMGPPGSTLNKSTGPSSALNKSAGPSSLLNKSAGASSMIGQKFMSNQIRLPNGNSTNQTGQARPGPTVPKPFNVSQNSMRPPQPPQQVHHTPKQPDEPYQELPEIDSEYSDSDDEAHEKKVAAFPRWAQSPALAHALMEQRKVNPDEIFGPIPPLSIQEIFRDSSSAARLRARTSSAQWEGTDAISQTEIARYHRVMGFTSGTNGDAAGQGR